MITYVVFKADWFIRVYRAALIREHILYNRYIYFNPRVCVCGAHFEAPTRLYARLLNMIHAS